MFGEAASDLGDRCSGGCDDRARSLAIAIRIGDVQCKFAGLLVSLGFDRAVQLKPQTSGLQDRRDRCADDVLPVLGEIGVTTR